MDGDAAMDQHGQGASLVSEGLSKLFESDQLYTEPMKRTSPESTYGFVVNHSHRKTEAKSVSQRSPTQLA